MKSCYGRLWSVMTVLAVLAILHVTMSAGAYGSEPLPPGQRIFDLYRAGKLTEARQTLHTWVVAQFDGIRTTPITSHVEAEGLLGGGVAARPKSSELF